MTPFLYKPDGNHLMRGWKPREKGWNSDIFPDISPRLFWGKYIANNKAVSYLIPDKDMFYLEDILRKDQTNNTGG